MLFEDNSTCRYRCKITDADGNVVYSQPGKIYLDTATVLEQPEDFYGVVGDKVIFTVKAGGNGLTYRWQVSTNGGSYWGDSTAGGYNTASMYVYMTGNNPGYLYRCKITDSYGNVVYSEPGQIKIAADTWTFTYNADGLRTSRTNGYTTYEYVYHGSQLTQMTVGDDVLKFGYDASGAPLYVIWNSSKYFYTTNLQGDVVAIVSANGNPVVHYTYDAWGNILSITGSRADNLGKLNPLRYRGYVYDQDTGLYYLQSRYYNPEWGRFINADAFVSTGQGLLGNNMFAYCLNNPVICYDPSGNICIETCRGDINLLNRDFSDFTCGGGGSLGSASSSVSAVVGLSLSASIVGAVAKWLDNGYADPKKLRYEVYDYSQELRQLLRHIPTSSPHVHHIVPVGNFSNRNSVTYAQLQEMHSILRNAGISVLFDPMNLVLVSAKTHASLHTDAYIAHVYSYISATDGSREQIYTALFWLRLEIAAQDGFSIGY